MSTTSEALTVWPACSRAKRRLGSVGQHTCLHHCFVKHLCSQQMFLHQWHLVYARHVTLLCACMHDDHWHKRLHSCHTCCRYGSGTEDQPEQRRSNLPERPEFPPPSLNLVPAFASDMPHKEGSDMLTVCAFLHSFSDLLNLPPVTVDSLLAAGGDMTSSQLL